MRRRKVLDTATLIALTAVTRFIFRSHYLYDIDSVNFALALQRFDPSVHQPHPPGYFLYICLGRLSNLLFHDTNTAFVAISIVFSCGAAVAIYSVANQWFGRNAATFAGLIFVFSPLAWFHGVVALTYVVETFFSALTGYLCWRVYVREAGFILPAAAVVGAAAGFRPSSALLLAPLLLFSLRKSSRAQAAVGVSALIVAMLAWFVPMLQISGGRAYVASLVSLWLMVPAKGTLLNSSVLNSVARACVIVGIYFLCFGCAAILPLRAVRGDFLNDRRKVTFTLMWIAPGLLFFTFVFLKFVNSGYLLALAPPFCAWMGLWASRWYAILGLRRALKIGLIGCFAAANTLVFIRAPWYCSYSSVRRFETELKSVITVLPRIASPRDTMIVGFDSHFLGYRHAGYYLPDYLTVQFPEVRLVAGTRVFAMEHRDTMLEKDLSAFPVRNFIIFPLPGGDDSYRKYMALVRTRFPSGALRTTELGGHEYSVGAIKDIGILFPVLEKPAVDTVNRQ